MKTPNKVECVQTTRVYDDYFKIDRYHVRHELYEGGMSDVLVRDVLERGCVAAVLPLDAVARKVILIEQFRPGPYSASLNKSGVASEASDTSDAGDTGHANKTAMMSANKNNEAFLHRPWMWECVAGVLEAGETPRQLVHREAMEEAGLQILDLYPMHYFLTSPGMSSETVHMFCGRVDSRNAGGIHGLKSEGENICVRVFTIDEAIALLDSGRITNGKTIIALQWLALHHEKIIARWADGAS